MKIYFKKLLSLLVLDEQSEANRIIKFIGIVFIILAFLYSTNFLKLTTLAIICISLSGIFFILADILEHFYDDQSKKKAIDYKARYKRMGYLKLGKSVFHFFAITTLVVGPYIDIISNEKYMSSISTTLSLLAIGLTIFKIGLDNSRKNLDSKAQLLDEIAEILEEKNSKVRDK